jgi:hypothetical protein
MYSIVAMARCCLDQLWLSKMAAVITSNWSGGLKLAAEVMLKILW